MKKLMLLLAVAGLIFVSCGGTKTQQTDTVVEEAVCPVKAMLEKWDTLAELDEEGQIALVGEMKSFFDENCKAKEEGVEAEEVSPEVAAMKADWENFENLDLEAKKALINKAFEQCCKKEVKAEETCVTE